MATFLGWLGANWFNLIQTAGITLGLLLPAITLRRDMRTRQLANLLSLKQEHRELWNTTHESSELARVLSPDVDLLKIPITSAEEIFLRQLIAHTATSWRFIQEGTPVELGAFRNDVAEVFCLPLPHLVWKKATKSQDPKFVTFVEMAVLEKPGNTRKENKSALF